MDLQHADQPVCYNFIGGLALLDAGQCGGKFAVQYPPEHLSRVLRPALT